MTTKQTDTDDLTTDQDTLGDLVEWPQESRDEQADVNDDQEDESGPEAEATTAQRRLRSPRALAGIALTLAILGLGTTVGNLTLQLTEAQQAADQRTEFLQAAQQGAVNLTSVDWQNAEGDVQRIVQSATGTFYDDFSNRAQPFIDVVKQVQSKTVGTVSMAGLESVSGEQARALVAVTVETTNAGQPEPTTKAWRMRIDVQKEGNDVKVANVEFVP